VSVLLFWAAFVFLFYTFVGYPVSLYLIDKYLVKKASDDIQGDLLDKECRPDVEVILIVRNVEQIIQKKIQSLLSLNYPKDKLSILIVSDQSEDNTVNLIESLKNPRIKCIDNKHKSSKSACLNQAIEQSDAEILLMTDARQTHEPDSLNYLVQHFTNPEIGAVSGELVLLDPETNQFAKGMDAYWRYEKFIRNLESKISSVPGVTGAIYAMRRADYQNIPDETLLDDVLIPMKMVMAGKKVLFENKAIAYDIPSDDAAREKIRKTRTLAGNWQLIEFQPQLLNPLKNKIWWQFVSHKMLRLLAPFYLLTIFFMSLYSSDNSYYKLAFLLQLIGYTIIGLAYFSPVVRKLPLVSMAQSFMTLMWFTTLGFWSFITRQHLTIWK
jgi:cellulose synthase/poly-beta-1,6-N-acetylglucosamine synthase-like glycosyltransferase